MRPQSSVVYWWVSIYSELQWTDRYISACFGAVVSKEFKTSTKWTATLSHFSLFSDRSLWLYSSVGKPLCANIETFALDAKMLRWYFNRKYPLYVCVLGTKADYSKTQGKKGLKIIQDPDYRRYGKTVDMDSALETFVPHRSDSELQVTLFLCKLSVFCMK